jgi:hypothetical protein
MKTPTKKLPITVYIWYDTQSPPHCYTGTIDLSSKFFSLPKIPNGRESTGEEPKIASTYFTFGWVIGKLDFVSFFFSNVYSPFAVIY